MSNVVRLFLVILSPFIIAFSLFFVLLYLVFYWSVPLGIVFLGLFAAGITPLIAISIYVKIKEPKIQHDWKYEVKSSSNRIEEYLDYLKRAEKKNRTRKTSA